MAGTAGAPQTITVTNTGTGALAFDAIAVSGGVDFVLGTNTCKGANIAPNGTCTVQVSFRPACTNGTAARSASLVLTDNVAGSPQSVPLSGTASGDFCFDPSTTATVTAGQTAVYSLVVNSPTAYKGSVSLACAGTPATTSCTLPASVTVPSQFTLSVATAASSIAAPSSRRAPNVPKQRTWMIGAWGLLILVWMLWALNGEPRRATMIRKEWSWMVPWMLLALFASSLWMAGCGGGSGTGSDPPISGTPAGTYSLVLTGKSANTTAQVTLTLTVQ